MNGLFAVFPPGDKLIFWSWVVLAAASLAVLWSVTEPIVGPYDPPDPGVDKVVFYRQFLWMVIGLVAMSVAARVPLRHLDQTAVIVFLVAVLLLAFILVAGPRIGGARRWLVLGPFRLQPSELAKVAFILVNANLLARSAEAGRSLAVTALSFGVMVVPMVLVLREPDLGTSLVFLAVWVGMVFWYGIPGILLLGSGSAVLSAVIMLYSESQKFALPWAVYIVVLVAILYFMNMNIFSKVLLLVLNVGFGLGIPFFWAKLKPYQQERILTFFDPTRDEFGTGYQAIQSKVAIGSGGLFGTHYLQGTQKGLAFLPERHTDFIFSVVGEELGFVGAAALLGVFALIILRGITHAGAARRPFASFVAVGVVSYFTFHVVVNVAITTGLLPVTGLPLPLISYGGSNILTSSILLGLLLNVSSRTFDD